MSNPGAGECFDYVSYDGYQIILNGTPHPINREVVDYIRKLKHKSKQKNRVIKEQQKTIDKLFNMMENK